MKKIILLLFILANIPLVESSPALAQCNGVFGSDTACGTVAGGPPGPVPFTTIVSAAGAVIGPGSSTIGCAAPWANTSGTLLGNNCGLSLSSAGTATFAPTLGTTNQAIVVNQTGPNSGSQTGVVFYNAFTVNDGVDVTGGGLASGLLQLNYNVTSNAAGERFALDVESTYSAAGSLGGADIIGIVPRTIASANSGGTSGSPANGVYGANPQAILLSGATYWGEAAGSECDTRVDSGASVKWRFGCAAISTGTQLGTTLDGAFEIGAAAGSWKNGIILNSGHGAAPLATTGCVICTDGVSETIATGIDLSAYTITTLLKGTGTISTTGAAAFGTNTITTGQQLTSVGVDNTSSTYALAITNHAGGSILFGRDDGAVIMPSLGAVTPGTNGWACLSSSGQLGANSNPCEGTATLNINGTVGATTPAAATVTTLGVGAAVVAGQAWFNVGTNLDLEYSAVSTFFSIKARNDANNAYTSMLLDASAIFVNGQSSGTFTVQGGFSLTAAAPTVSSGQVGYGATVEAAGSGTCPSGTVGGQTVEGCMIINVAGTTRYQPYF